MIQLIASDMDGTLLPPYTSEVSEQAKEQIDRLIQNGILFCPCSGRQYPNLKMMFEPLGDRIPYICENGAAVILHGEPIAVAPMDRALCEELLRDIIAHDNYELQVNVVRTCYLQPKNPEYLHLMRDIVKNHVTVVEDIFSITHEPILKVSIYCPDGVPAEYVKGLQDKYGREFQILQSSEKFIDATAQGIHKGWGMEQLANYLDIPLKDVIAMGDHNNDVEILQTVGHPIAMKNGLPKVQALAERTITRVEDFLDELLCAVEAEEEDEFFSPA